VGPWLSAHPGVDKLAFTGSTATGKRVMSSASESLKRLTLELGGNDAAIVLPDVDVEEVAKALFWTAFGNSGQVCIATKRVYIHEKIYDAFADALVAYAKTVKLGDGLSPETQMGPIQNRRQLERLRLMLQEARAQGLRLRFVGEVPPGDGYFFPIVLVDDPPEEAAVVAEEAFGPILPLLRFRDVNEVVARVNAGRYGLGGSVWAKDVTAAVAVAENVQTGTVWVNQPTVPSAGAPFAGRRQSGVGSENGLEGILEYTAIQTLMLPAGQAVR
jgi:acyl-CoA reductase-like NAD-dependent aldehyde dehydrogenase